MIAYSLLKELCALSGISGDEDRVRRRILDEIRPYADTVRVDPLGNILVHKKGKSPAKSRLLISAHMDEVGLMVTDITSDGYLKFDEVGGIDRRVLPGKRVLVGDAALDGVIGIKPIHLTEGDEESAIPKMTELYIDIGASNSEEAEKLVRVGDSVSFRSDFYENNKTIRSKAIDDRFGCLVLIGLIKSELEYDADFSFVVQEEVGLRGARVASYTTDPEFALVVETTTAADVPEVEESRRVCRLGEGAVISVMDRHTIYDRELVRYALDCAAQTGAKAQYKRAVAGGNDAGAIHQSRGGVRTLAVSLPCRYLHAPNCVADKDDCESVMKLVAALAEAIAGGVFTANGDH